MPVAIPEAGPVRILARVRGMSALERSTYTTGWPLSGEAGSGVFSIRIGERKVGAIPVEGFPWHWVALDAGAVPLTAGGIVLEVATRDAGIAMDNILVTNDPDFVPRGRGQVPEDLAEAPEGLRVEPFGLEDERAASESIKRAETSRESGVAACGRAAGRVALQCVSLEYESVRGGSGDAPGQSERARVLRRRSRGRADGVLPRPRRGRLGQSIASLCSSSRGCEVTGTVELGDVVD